MTVIAGRYRVHRTLGSGGMAEVLAAHDERLGRDVAIKLIRTEFLADPSIRERLLREARSAAALHHPNTVTVFDTGEDEGRPYIVMQLIDGESLADRLRRDAPLPVEETVEVGVALVAGLQAAHARGIVHRDVKPSNVLLSTDGEIKLADFGIAKALDGTDPALTTTGAMLGTPRYLSPEQAAGGEATPASDQYSLGAVLYECLAGRPPFQGDSAVAVALAHQQRTPPPLAELAPDVPAGLAAVVERALAKDPEARFPEVSAMGMALAEAALGGNGAGLGTTVGSNGGRIGPSGTGTRDDAGTATASLPETAASRTAVLADADADGAGGSVSTGGSGGSGGADGERTFHPRRRRMWWALGAGALAIFLAVAVLPGLLGGDAEGDGPGGAPLEGAADAEDPTVVEEGTDGDEPEADADAEADPDPGAGDEADVEAEAGTDELLPDDEALAQLDEVIADLAEDPDAAGRHGNRLLRQLLDLREEEDAEDRAEDARGLVRDIASWLTRDHIDAGYAEAVVPPLVAIGTPDGEGLDEVAGLFAAVALDKEAWGKKAKDLLDDLDDLIGEDPADRPEDAVDIIDEIDEWIEKDELDADRGRRAQETLERFVSREG